MSVQIQNYRIANEVLYVLFSFEKNDFFQDNENETSKSVSKIGLQKFLYLSKTLAPIKDVILSSLQFISWKRGPYSKDIQNITDQLSNRG